ncbi:MAG: hypothetical protein KF878_07105 [Planctomycetes bacterium]|nr:hypothetical protein [Planctomycetota bacterium]
MRHDDDAAWLREQVRRGRLDPERLALAAALGHEPSIEALDEPPPWFEPEAFFARFGREALVRVALAVAEAARLRVPDGDPEEPLLDHMLGALRAWCVEPRGTRAPDDLLGEGVMAAQERSGARQPRFWALQIAAHACGLTAGEASLMDPISSWPSRLGLTSEAVLAAARADVVPWALGGEDPVARRLADAGARLDAHAARWRETGSDDALAAWLLARYHAGRVSAERLALAAALGHEGAALTLGRRPEGDPLDAIRRAARDAGPEALVRLALAAARSAARGATVREVEAALSAGEAWTACPCDAHRAAVVGPWRALQTLVETDGAARTAHGALRWCDAPDRPDLWPAAEDPADDEANDDLADDDGPEDEDDDTDGAFARLSSAARALAEEACDEDDDVEDEDVDALASPDDLDEVLERTSSVVRSLLDKFEQRLQPLTPGDDEHLPFVTSCLAACTNATAVALETLEASGLASDPARARLRQALRDAVAPWALGLDDLER